MKLPFSACLHPADLIDGVLGTLLITLPVSTRVLEDLRELFMTAGPNLRVTLAPLRASVARERRVDPLSREIQKFRRRLRSRLRNKLNTPLTIYEVNHEYGWNAAGEQALFVQVHLDPEELVESNEYATIEEEVEALPRHYRSA
jgi:hypothetical protein